MPNEIQKIRIENVFVFVVEVVAFVLQIVAFGSLDWGYGESSGLVKDEIHYGLFIQRDCFSGLPEGSSCPYGFYRHTPQETNDIRIAGYVSAIPQVISLLLGFIVLLLLAVRVVGRSINKTCLNDDAMHYRFVILLLLQGVLEIIGAIVWSFIGSSLKKQVVESHISGAFYLALITGIVTTILSLTVFCCYRFGIVSYASLGVMPDGPGEDGDSNGVAGSSSGDSMDAMEDRKKSGSASGSAGSGGGSEDRSDAGGKAKADNGVTASRRAPARPDSEDSIEADARV